MRRVPSILVCVFAISVGCSSQAPSADGSMLDAKFSANDAGADADADAEACGFYYSEGYKECPHCHDGIRDGAETDVDCGGPFPGDGCVRRCKLGQGCTSGWDCVGTPPDGTGYCPNNVCSVRPLDAGDAAD